MSKCIPLFSSWDNTKVMPCVCAHDRITCHIDSGVEVHEHQIGIERLLCARHAPHGRYALCSAEVSVTLLCLCTLYSPLMSPGDTTAIPVYKPCASRTCRLQCRSAATKVSDESTCRPLPARRLLAHVDARGVVSRHPLLTL